jgi:hypothetical protein
MPASRGRYQSRVLSFLSQQSLQWRDRLLEKIRETQFNVSWGVQVLLYPMYVLFQSGRLVGQQLRDAGRRLAPLLAAVKDDAFDPSVGVPPLDIDAPFRGMFEALTALDLSIEIDSEVWARQAQPLLGERSTEEQRMAGQAGQNVALSQATLTIRGLASSLESHRLILTNADNQVIDILKIEQQQWLYQRMIFEVASYRRRQALLRQASHPSVRPLYPNQGTLSKADSLAWRFLPPLQHKDTIAPPIRFFRSLMTWMQFSPIAQAANVFQESALPTLGHGSAPLMLEPPQLPKVSQSVQFMTKALRGTADSLTQIQTGSGKQDAPPANPDSDEWFDPDRHNSMDGWFSANHLNALRRQAEQFLSMPSLPLRRRWLSSWDEHDSGSDSLMDSPVDPLSVSHPNRHPAATATTGRLPNSLAAKAHASASKAADDVWIAPVHDPSGNLSPTLLETKATVVSYEKHPLEHVLEWIDGVMLWFEENASKALRWLHSAFKREIKGQDSVGRSPDNGASQEASEQEASER